MIRRTRRIFWQVIDRRLIQQEKERVEATIQNVVIHAIKTSIFDTSFMQRAETLTCPGFELLHLAKLNGVGWTGLGTRGHHVILQAVITERAFVRHVVAHLITSNHSKGTGDNTVATAIADILLHVYRVKLCANNGPRRTRLLARCIGAVLTDIAVHQPAVGTEEGQSRSRRRLRNGAVVSGLSYLSLEQWNGWWE